jgi:hypothetical protein
METMSNETTNICGCGGLVSRGENTLGDKRWRCGDEKMMGNGRGKRV